MRTLSYTSVPVESETATVGEPIDPREYGHWNSPDSALFPDGFDPSGRTGFVANINSPYDGAGPDAAYDRTQRSGRIIPVNTETPRGNLVVIWDKRDFAGFNVAWPTRPVLFNIQWPANPEQIVITSGLGSELKLQGAPLPVGGTGLPVRINAGGPEFTAGDGTIFEADNYSNSGAATGSASAIEGTNDDPLYQKARTGFRVEYAIPVPGASFYNVTLHFAETQFSQVGQRRFDILLEGEIVEEDFDPVFVAGANNAIQRTYRVATSDSFVDLQLVSDFGESHVSAISIEAASTSAFAVNCGGPQATLGGVTFLADTAFIGGASYEDAVDESGAAVLVGADEEIYRSGRAGSLVRYELPTGDGSFDVTLHFSEREPPAIIEPDDSSEIGTAPTQPEGVSRAATITLEGETVDTAFMILEEAGDYNTPLTLTYPAVVKDGVLHIVLSAPSGIDEAQINAISVMPALLVEQEKLDPAKFRQAHIYHQPDRNLPGYNPNEEHGLLAPSQGSDFNAAFALRMDLNHRNTRTSDPYVLLKFQDGTNGDQWAYKVYEVSLTKTISVGATDHVFDFAVFTGFAGKRVQPPYPLSTLTAQEETERGEVATGLVDAYWEDHKGAVWARSAGQIVVKYHYPLLADFWYDLDGGGNPDNVTSAPWLEFVAADEEPGNGTPPGEPIKTVYNIEWPPFTPELFVGETLREAKRGLPGISDWAAAAIIYDDNEDAIPLEPGDVGVTRPLNFTARIVDSMSGRQVDLQARINGEDLASRDGSVDFGIKMQLAEDGLYQFKEFPPHLKLRMRYDPINEKLIFRGYAGGPNPSTPIEMLNIMSESEKAELLALSEAAAWDAAIAQLFDLTRNPNSVDRTKIAGLSDDTILAGIQHRLVGDQKQDDIIPEDVLATPALSAGLATGTGFMTLAENNDPSLGAAPVALHVIKVMQPASRGSLRLILPDNPLDEKVSLRHSLDFGGDPDKLFFEWYYKPATGSGRPSTTPDSDSSWLPLVSGRGLNSTVIEGSGLLTLSDNWIFCRYRAADGVTGTLYPQNPDYSGFAGDPSFVSVERPMFVPGWIKRVLEGINPFEQRFSDFHQSPIQTYVTMLQQVGPPFEGPVALNGDPEFLNSIGLLQLYETVLRRGMDLSINGIPNQSHDGTNTALLLAASRIADLFMLLGNEAFADSQDPTLGFNFGAEGEFSTITTSSFAFQNVLPSLLSEELALLRGRDQSLAGTELGPVFNRLYWNFSSGLEGEPAYALNYQVTDVDGVGPTGGTTGVPDGFIRELDAATLYPQGHGDAWGHYLSAIKTYYRLLRHHKFNWSTRAEYTLISGVPHAVDYLDEVKFARAAAARTKAGESVVDLTYREQYTSDPAGQWQGYKDTQEDTIPNSVPDEIAPRSWGVDEWARRSGQGAMLDWVVANAILPEEDTVDATETQVNDTLGGGTTPVSRFNQSSIDKIDRTTVGELVEIASGYDRIQDILDQADRGMNPLGLAENVTPFDVDPSINEIGDDGERTTHFEQIFNRATAAVTNAKSAFEHANGLTERIRQLRIDQDDFQRESEDVEFDFKNRLIELFGYPYAGHIGPGKPYPDGYDGPDLYMYNYVDVAEVNGDADNLAIQEPVDLNGNGRIDSDEISDIQNQFDTFSAFFDPMELGVADGDNGIQDTIAYYFPEDVSGGQGTFSGEPLQIDYQLSTRRWAFHAEGLGERRAEGAIQLAINNMVQAEAELLTAISNYGSLVSEINDQIDLLEAQEDLQDETIKILTDRAAGITALNVSLGITNTLKTGFEQAAEGAEDIGDAISDALPKFNVFGTSNGVDAFAAARGLVKTASTSAEFAIRSGVVVTDGAVQAMEFAKEETELWTDIEIAKDGFEFEVQERLKELEQTMRNEVTTRLELFNLEQALRAAVAEYKSTLAEGQRVLHERIIARRRLAGPVQQLRYQDIAFRNFRNEALQRYKAAFDVASRYVFIAAKVYDYETTLLNSSSQSGQAFLTNIVKQRSVGLFEDDIAVHGVDGLSDPMARMRANFRVLKGQLGFNNPQIETGQFSLRHELFRMKDSSEEAWQKLLATHVVDDLWELPEFRRYCRPFAPEEAGRQPGIVIEFPTTVTFGLNFFGWPLAGGDSSYDSANFATKILGNGLWFENYNGNGLANTPRAYLVPAGLDVQRSPTFDSLATREFNVVDQVLPVPFPIGNAQLSDPNYIPQIDSLDNSFAQVRRMGRFRAYHDDPDLGNSEFPEDQLEITTRLVGRSVWNTRWMLIIPGGTFLNDPDEGIRAFIFGQKIPGSDERDGNGVSDIKLFFQTYAYSGI
ncbi:MAG: malectin domain-containing carbohydrate-binding protein [Verrucomicrobiota bacterium]